MSETNGSTNGHKPPLLLPGEPKTAKPECGSPKRKGGICRSTVLYANGRCKLHGGAALKGMAAPSYSHGRYSKYMPAGLRDDYVALLNDPTLNQLRPEIALVAQMLDEKLAQLRAGESRDLWQKCVEALARYRSALEEQAFGYEPSPSPEALLSVLSTLIDDGLRTFDVFKEIQPILEQHRKLVETENKRIHQISQVLTTEQAVAFVRQLGDSVKRHVSNPKEVSAVLDDFTRVIAR